MALMIDTLILLLLFGILTYAWIVDRRVRRLTKILRELAPLVGEFSQAVDKSENSAAALRAAADQMGRRAESIRTEPEEPRFSTRRNTDTHQRRRSERKHELVRSFFEATRGSEA